jgi:hypothetical protein
LLFELHALDSCETFAGSEISEIAVNVCHVRSYERSLDDWNLLAELQEWSAKFALLVHGSSLRTVSVNLTAIHNLSFHCLLKCCKLIHKADFFIPNVESKLGFLLIKERSKLVNSALDVWLVLLLAGLGINVALE